MQIFSLVRKPVLRFLSRRLVTPFTGFVLSHFYLASEIEKYGLEFLNQKSRNLSEVGASEVSADSVLYVQVDQLELFVDRHLGNIKQPFVLITGKWHLPGIERSSAVDEVLANPFLTRWFSQNQIFEDLPIRPFPFGVNLSSTLQVWLRMHSPLAKLRRRSGVFVPHVAVHEHLRGVARDAREGLQHLMRERMSFPRYLDEIGRCEYVISPPGDRPDTYRHWEAIALGATPVSNLSGPFEDLFGPRMVFVADMAAVAQGGSLARRKGHLSAVARVSHWRKIISRT